MLDRLFPKDPFIDYSVEAVIETRIEVIDMDWARCKYPAGHPANIQSTAQILGCISPSTDGALGDNGKMNWWMLTFELVNLSLIQE